MNARHTLILSAVAAVAIPSFSYGAAATIYDLGVQPGGTYSTAEAVSNIDLGGGNWGAVGQQSDPTNGAGYGYFGFFPWSTLNTLEAGNVQNLFGTPAVTPPGAQYEFANSANGINDSGVVAGIWFDFNRGYVGVAYDSNTNTMQELPILAEHITNSGVIVGMGGDPAGLAASKLSPAGVGSYGAPIVLDRATAAGYQSSSTEVHWALASNEAGSVIAGSVYQSPAVWKMTGATTSEVTLLPTLNAGPGSAADINQANVIVGGTGDAATLWAPDGLGNYTAATNLGKLDAGDDVAQAFGINNHGLVVGYSGNRGATGDRPYTGEHDAVTGWRHFAALWDDTFGLTYGASGAIDNMEAFVYDPLTSSLINIESLLAPAYASWDIAMALDINDANVVAAIAKDTAGDGLYHGVLIQVPEPGSLALLGLAGSLLGLRRRSR